MENLGAHTVRIGGGQGWNWRGGQDQVTWHLDFNEGDSDEFSAEDESHQIAFWGKKSLWFLGGEQRVNTNEHPASGLRHNCRSLRESIRVTSKRGDGRWQETHRAL